MIIWTRCKLDRPILLHCLIVTLTFELKIKTDHLDSTVNICTKFGKCTLNCCLMIIWTRFKLDRPILPHCLTVTLTFDLKIRRDHLDSTVNICTKFEKCTLNWCLMVILTRCKLDRPILPHCLRYHTLTLS